MWDISRQGDLQKNQQLHGDEVHVNFVQNPGLAAVCLARHRNGNLEMTDELNRWRNVFEDWNSEVS